jgi:phosphoesterase RecJ-like protein
MNSLDWSPFVAIVRGHRRFLVTSHIRPDCDALGSELAMACVLETLQKQVRIVNGQATPPNLAFIDRARRIAVLGHDVTGDQLRDAEVVMVLDTSSWAQLGPMSELVRETPAVKLVIDHHVSEDDLGALPFRDPTVEATGRLVVDAADALGVALVPEMAAPLFAALATDTGWFRFSSTSASTYQLAARLVAAGASPTRVYADLYERDSEGRVRLRGLILSRVQTELGGRLVHTYALRGDFQAVGALLSDTEDVINMTMAIAGTEVAVILVEQPQGGFKLSFRSRSDVDCNRLARQFGGGGHKAAAGASINLPFEAAQPKVLEAVRAAMT